MCEPEDGGPALCPTDCASSCGDCKCSGGEDFSTCPIDCGYCGDGVCSPCSSLAESHSTCPADCKGNSCVGGCDDGNACTVDICGSDGNCVHVTNAGGCDDSNPCTDDSCDAKANACVHAPTPQGAMTAMPAR